jgi:hypothetical protein
MRLQKYFEKNICAKTQMGHDTLWWLKKKMLFTAMRLFFTIVTARDTRRHVASQVTIVCISYIRYPLLTKPRTCTLSSPCASIRIGAVLHSHYYWGGQWLFEQYPPPRISAQYHRLQCQYSIRSTYTWCLRCLMGRNRPCDTGAPFPPTWDNC